MEGLDKGCSMDIGRLVGWLVSWICGQILAATWWGVSFSDLRMQVGGNRLSMQEVMNTLTGVRILSQNFVSAVFDIPIWMGDLFEIYFKMYTWDFPFLTGGLQWIRLPLFFFSVAFTWAILAFVYSIWQGRGQ